MPPNSCSIAGSKLIPMISRTASSVGMGKFIETAVCCMDETIRPTESIKVPSQSKIISGYFIYDSALPVVREFSARSHQVAHRPSQQHLFAGEQKLAGARVKTDGLSQ